jgi:integrase
MRRTDEGRHGWRLRALIVVLWRGGLRIQEALALAEHNLDQRRGSLLVRNGKGGKRREVGMDEWGWEQLRPGWAPGPSYPSGRCSASSTAPPAGDPGRAPRFARSFAGSQRGQASGVASPRTSCATSTRFELAREGIPLNIIQRQPGHANLGTTSIYLQGIDPEEIIATVRARRPPMMSASAGLRL